MKKTLSVAASWIVPILLAATVYVGISSGWFSPNPDVTSASQLAITSPVIVDVRTAEEFSEQHIVGAANIDINSPEFLDRFSDYSFDRQILVYCRSGNRSRQATTILRNAGFTNVIDLGSMLNANAVLSNG
jgi:rhodanese-related sulfurtransferase